MLLIVARVWLVTSVWWLYYVASDTWLLHLASFLPSSQPIISSHTLLTVSARAVSVRTSDMTRMLTHYTEFDVHVTAHRVKFLIIKPTRCTNFSNFFLEWKSTCFGQFLHPSSGVFRCNFSNLFLEWNCTCFGQFLCQSSGVFRCNFSNLFLEWNCTCFGQFLCPSSGVFHCTDSNSICHTGLLSACEQDQDRTQFHPDPARKLSAKLYNIYHCCVYIEKLLMMDTGTVLNMYSFTARINFRNYSGKLLMMDRGTVRNM